jgi:hypothetical protein
LSCQYPRATQQGQQAIDSSFRLTETSVGPQNISTIATALPQNSFHFNSEALTNISANSTAFQPTFDSDSTFWNPALLSTINWLDTDIQDFESFQPHLATVHDQPPFNSTGRLYQENFPFTSLHGAVSTPDGLSHGSNTSILSPESTQSQTNSSRLEGPASGPGEYYVDGEAARLPRVKRRKLKLHSTSQGLTPEVPQFSLRFPALPPGPEKVSPDSYIDEDTYSQIRKFYEQLCLHRSGSDIAFEAVDFPTLPCLAHLMDLYFENFNSIIPIFYPPTCGDEPRQWLLSLTMLTIGSVYLEAEQSETFSHSMHEFNRRAIASMDRGNILISDGGLSQIHISTLDAIARSYSERIGSRRIRAQLLWDLSDCNSLSATIFVETTRKQNASTEEIELEWRMWRHMESLRRTWYAVWILDCMWAFHFEDRPTLTLDDAIRPLPCHESLWNAETSTDWYQLQSKYPPTPTLIDALQKMYIDKHVSPELGEFSRQLLIHGLFRRSWEVGTHLSQRLSHWEPTAQKQVSGEALPRSPIWLPSVPTFTKWRNSACDCIDILHWDANAKIGAASGLEHPTVLHLHLSRVILLTPFREIARLAEAIADGRSSDIPEQTRQDQDIVHRWATQDQFKARLAMIHAGVLFWHVRRHSANAFYEPSSIYIATLALWAFSAFSPDAASGETRAGGNGNEIHVTQAVPGDDMEMPTSEIILLDRPTDDELVQEFVRNGSRMWPQMSRVGNLYGRHAAGRVLAVGKELLDTLTCWKIARRQSRTLEALREVWKPETGGGS